MPQFPELTKMELTASGKTMSILLKRAPALKSLVYEMDSMGPSSLPENVPDCVANNLREIRIKGFRGFKFECAAVRYFLQHGAVLEKMLIELKGRVILGLPSSAMMRLIKQSRRSPDCEMEFLECWNSLLTLKNYGN